MIQARTLADLDGVQHRFFTRQGGVSEGLYSSLNCGYGSGDLPDNVRETHISLFDNSNCGIELTDRPAFSVQYHPEASPGPQDSFYLFERFVKQLTKETSNA